MLPPRSTLSKSIEGNEHLGSRCSLSKSSFASDTQSSYTSTVYLRIKPNPKEMSAEETDSDIKDICAVFNSTTLRVFKRHTLYRKFTFTRIFDSDFGQADFFDHAVRQRIVNFLQGESSTIIAHGALNSGKTYTMFGTPESPGLIPRSFKLLFSSVNCTLAPWYRITEDGRVVALDEHERAQEAQRKEDTINPRVIGKDDYLQARLSAHNSTSGLSEPEDEERCSDECMSSVWISVAEIYNAAVYDLLIFDESERTSLTLATRKDGSTYAKGLKFVHITTALEACQLLVSVQSRMRVSSTSVNTASSLSHTFLTVNLLKYPKDNVPEEVRVSTLTFCDLAGYRPLRKGVETQRTELRSINNSLLALNKCLRKIRERQSIGGQTTGPIRESKLTRILQKVLAGREKVCFVVAVDTSIDAFPQTLRVLNILPMAKQSSDKSKTGKRNVLLASLPRSMKSSTATSVTQSPEKVVEVGSEANETPEERNRRLLEEVEALRVIVGMGQMATAKVTRETQSEHTFVGYETLKKENESLAAKLKAMECDRFNRELEIRQDLADQYSAAIEQFESTWKKRAQDIEDEGRDLLKWSVSQVETFYKERIDSMTYRKKRNMEDSENEKDDGTSRVYENLETEDAMVTSKVVVLREMIRGLKAENELLKSDRNRSNFQLALTKKRLTRFFDSSRIHFPELFSNIGDTERELAGDDLSCRHSIDNADLTTQDYPIDGHEYSSKKVSLNSIDTDIDHHISRSNDNGNTKEDSGIDCSCRSRRSTVVPETKDEKGTQIDDPPGYSIDELDHSNFERYYVKHKLLDTWLCVARKLSDLNSMIDNLQRIAHVNKRAVAACKDKLVACEMKMEELERENVKLTRTIELDHENDRSEQSNRSLQRCLQHERLLAEFHFVHEQMEKCFANCKCDPREVEKLDRFLVTLECLGQNGSKVKVEEDETDLFRVLQLYDEFQKVKKHCRERLSEYVEAQSMLGMKFEWLSVALRNRDDQMLALKSEIAQMGLADSVESPASSASQIVRPNESSTLVEGLKSESVVKCEESCPTESSGLDDSILDARQIQSDASDCSEVACGCGIGFKNTARQAEMSGWMKVKRSNASTNLLRRLDGV